MTVRECYEKMGANYDGVLSRLGNEMLIKEICNKISQRIRASGSHSCKKKDAESAFLCGTYIERHLPEPGV